MSTPSLTPRGMAALPDGLSERTDSLNSPTGSWFGDSDAQAASEAPHPHRRRVMVRYSLDPGPELGQLQEYIFTREHMDTFLTSDDLVDFLCSDHPRITPDARLRFYSREEGGYVPFRPPLVFPLSETRLTMIRLRVVLPSHETSSERLQEILFLAPRSEEEVTGAWLIDTLCETGEWNCDSFTVKWYDTTQNAFVPVDRQIVLPREQGPVYKLQIHFTQASPGVPPPIYLKECVEAVPCLRFTCHDCVKESFFPAPGDDIFCVHCEGGRLSFDVKGRARPTIFHRTSFPGGPRGGAGDAISDDEFVMVEAPPKAAGAMYNPYESSFFIQLRNIMTFADVNGGKKWDRVVIPNDPHTARVRLRNMIRRGVPNDRRRKVWMTITGATLHMDKRPNAYKDALTAVFQNNPDRVVLNVPAFGGAITPDRHLLSHPSTKSMKRLLCVLAQRNPDISFFPILPDIVSALLHFMSECEVYFAADAILRRTRSDKWFMSLVGTNFVKVGQTFNDLIRQHLQKTYAQMVAFDIAHTTFSTRWFEQLFVTSVPYPVFLRVLDAFLNEGTKILYRIGLALLKFHEKALWTCQDAGDWGETLNLLASNVTSVDSFMKVAFSFPLRRHKLAAIAEKIPVSDTEIRPMNVFYLPKLEKPSAIIPEEMFEDIWNWLPKRHRIRDPKLVFSTEEDGWSLITLYARSPENGPVILLLRTSSGRIFGCCTSHPWQKAPSVYGTGECFLFSLVPEKERYGWQGGHNNTQFMLADTSGLSLGGGEGYGLHISSDLTSGTSLTTLTFKNPPLGGDSDVFSIVALEMYAVE